MLSSQPHDDQSPECHGGIADGGVARGVITDRDALVAVVSPALLDEEEESIRIILKKILTEEVSPIRKLVDNCLVTFYFLNIPENNDGHPVQRMITLT